MSGSYHFSSESGFAHWTEIEGRLDHTITPTIGYDILISQQRETLARRGGWTFLRVSAVQVIHNCGLVPQARIADPLYHTAISIMTAPPNRKPSDHLLHHSSHNGYLSHHTLHD